MKTQLKIAATLALTAAGFIATAPAHAVFPSSALEFSQQTYVYPQQPTAQSVSPATTSRIVLAYAPTYEPISD